MITIVDYGMGNLGSISNMLKKIGVACQISPDAAAIAQATRIILPGIGAFDAGMRKLRERGLVEVLRERVLEQGVPVLGICLGMHLMTRASAEGSESGLGWIDASVQRFNSDPGGALKVPHMGWRVVQEQKPSPLLERLAQGSRFYFVHSYYVHCNDRSDVLLSADYGTRFDAAFQSGSIVGVQFHPEKSHKFGMQLLRNFAGGL